MTKRMLLINAEGWTAQFRVHSTITTQLTHIIPPPSTILGLLFAKIGLLRDYSKWQTEKYNEYLQKIKIGIAYNGKRINKFIDYNLYLKLKEKEPEKMQKPTQVEYIVNPSYCFVLLYDDEDPILSKLNPNEEVFKTYLGINESPAIINECKLVEYKEKYKDELTTKFAVPQDIVSSIRVDDRSANRPELELETIPKLSPPKDSKLYKNTSTDLSLYVPLGNYIKFQLKEKQTIYEVIFDGKKEEVVLL